MAFKIKDLMINITPEAVAQPLTCLEGVSCDVGRTAVRPLPCACTDDFTCGWSRHPVTQFFAQPAVATVPMTCFAGASCDVGRTGIRPVPCACTGDFTCGISRHPVTVFYAQAAAGAGGVGAVPECALATACACSYFATGCAGCTVLVSACFNRTGVCAEFSFITPTLCPTATVIGPVPVPVGGDPVAASQQLAALKVQLQQALADLEKQQEAVEANLQPQTVAQVEELQSKMRDALDELDKRKTELQQKQSQPKT